MLPPLFLPDLRAGSAPRAFEEREPLRRGAPARLRIDPVPPGTPHLTLRALGPPPPPPPPPLPPPKPARRGGWLPRLRRPRWAPAT